MPDLGLPRACLGMLGLDLSLRRACLGKLGPALGLRKAWVRCLDKLSADLVMWRASLSIL